MQVPIQSSTPISRTYRFVLGALRPPMDVLTKQDWHGAENLDQPGGIVVATNHLSYFDPIVLGHFMVEGGRPARFLAKASLFDLPILGRIIRGCGTIPVYRDSRDAVKSVRAAIDAARGGDAVVLFVEGTITRDPDLWPMAGKTGAARIALVSGAPVIPMAHWGSHEVLPAYKRAFKLFPRKTMHVIAGPPVDLSDLATLPINAATLELANERIMAAIVAQLETIRGERAPRRLHPRIPGTKASV